MQQAEQQNSPAKPFLIGITGGSGSGKSTFIRRIREQFSEDQVCIISMDDYYLPVEFQKEDPNGKKNFDLPKSFDKKAFRAALENLLNWKTVERVEHVFNNPLKTPRTLVFHPAPVIIVEGLFVFHFKKVQAMYDLKIFINAKENLKVIRRIYRDQVERNYPVEDVLYQYQHHVLPAFEKYIAPHKEEADIVINNNQSFDRGLDVVKGYIAHLLMK